MSKHILQAVVTLLMLVPGVAHAQWSFDVESVEALIDDHKNVRSVLAIRAAAEYANRTLHNDTQKAVIDYDSLNVKLDKYTKCFDIIDIIYNSGITVMNVYNTSSDVTQRVSDLVHLIDQFVSSHISKGNIVSSDTLIVNTCRRCLVQVVDDGTSLVNSLVELAQYASGLRHMTSAQLLIVISHINESLDSIRECVDHTYYVIWKYVTIRTHYFKRTLYNSKTLREMCHDAFSRWRAVTKEIGY